MKNNDYTDEQWNEALESARRDIAKVERYIGTVGTGLRKYDLMNLDDPGRVDRESKIATMCQMISEAWDHKGAILLAATAMQMLVESDAELESVHDDNWYLDAQQKVEALLRETGVIR